MKPIDIKQVKERIGLNKKIFLKLINMFREEFPHKLKALKASIDENDFNKIQEIGHHIKGSSANLCLPYLQIESSRMETAGQEKDIQKAQKAYQNLNKEFEHFNNLTYS